MALRTIGSGGDHSSIALAEAVANYGDELRIIDTATYTGQITWAGAGGTPSASNDLKLTCLTENGGSFTAGPKQNSTNSHVNNVNEDWLHFVGLRVEQGGTGSSDECFRINSGVDNILIERCIITATSRVSDQDGLYAGTASTVGPISCVNCIFQGFGRAGIHPQNNNATNTQDWRTHFCTFDQCGDTGEVESGGLHARIGDSANTNLINLYNSVSVRSLGSIGDFAETEVSGGVNTWSGSHNAVSDTSLTTIGLTTGAVESLVPADAFTAPDSNDYTLKAGSALEAAGVDRTGSPPDTRCDLTVDITGATRPATPSIGAFDVAAAGGGDQTLSLDAVVQKGRSSTLSLDGALQKQNLLATTSLTAALAKTQSVASDLEAAVEAQKQAVAGLEAALQATRAASLDVDAAVQVARTAGADLDATVALAASILASADAALRKTLTATASLDANVIAEVAGQISAALEAAIQARIEAQAQLDAALIAVDRTSSASLDAAAQSLKTADADLDSAVRKALLATLGLDARVIAEALGEEVIGLDAALLAVRQAEAALDAALQMSFGVGADADAALSALRAVEGDLDAIVLRTLTTTVGLDARIAVPSLPEVITSLDAALRDAFAAQAQVDAGVAVFVSASADLDAVIGIAATVAASLDAALWASPTLTAALQAAITVRREISAGLDSIVVQVGAVTSALDAGLRRGISATAVLDAVIGEIVLVANVNRLLRLPARPRLLALVSDPRRVAI